MPPAAAGYAKNRKKKGQHNKIARKVKSMLFPFFDAASITSIWHDYNASLKVKQEGCSIWATGGLYEAVGMIKRYMGVTCTERYPI